MHGLWFKVGNYILKQGDVINIPTVENIVTVRGQIDYPFEK